MYSVFVHFRTITIIFETLYISTAPSENCLSVNNFYFILIMPLNDSDTTISAFERIALNIFVFISSRPELWFILLQGRFGGDGIGLLT